MPLNAVEYGGAAGTAMDAELFPMNSRVDHILEDMLGLSAKERCAVAAVLIDSLESAPDLPRSRQHPEGERKLAAARRFLMSGEENSVAEAWRTELLRRRAELHAGVARTAPWPDVSPAPMAEPLEDPRLTEGPIRQAWAPALHDPGNPARKGLR